MLPRRSHLFRLLVVASVASWGLFVLWHRNIDVVQHVAAPPPPDAAPKSFWDVRNASCCLKKNCATFLCFYCFILEGSVPIPGSFF